MNRLKIRLFGNMELRDGSTVLTEFPTQKSKGLLAFLLLGSERLFARQTIAGVFWPDRPDAHARKCLRNELWRLKNILAGIRPHLVNCITVHSDAIGFAAKAPFWLDVEVFERDVASVLGIGRKTLTANHVETLKAAIELYRGDLLDGLYDDWCLHRREALRLQYLSALELLMRHYQQEMEWSLALQYGQRILAQDPLLEHIHRDVIRVYALMKDRPAALRQYEKCVELLRRELDVDPMRETVEVYRALLDGEPTVRTVRKSAVGFAHRGPNVAPLENIRCAIDKLDSARTRLVDATRQLDAAGGDFPRSH